MSFSISGSPSGFVILALLALCVYGGVILPGCKQISSGASSLDKILELSV